MTLVVSRISKGRIAITSDTLLTEHERRLPHQQGVIKSCMLPGGICVSFANSPELAKRDFREFSERFPAGTGFVETVSFFEQSSASTGNDYIIAFAATPRLAKIVDGKRTTGVASTQWIGDKHAYERFREYEARHRKRVESGRAINGVLFADELANSPASDLYSTMRHVIADGDVNSTGGFACVISSRNNGFRHSVYSDMLFNWPETEAEDFVLQLSHQIDLGASGENKNYSIAQISTGFTGLNAIAFYVLKGRKLFLYHGIQNGLADNCRVISDVEPEDINMRLTEALEDLRWLLMITSASEDRTSTVYRLPPAGAANDGIGISMFTHANTFPQTG